MNLEAFAATEINEIFSGRKPRQGVEGLVLPNYQHILKMGTEFPKRRKTLTS
jgi:hypothetical protein